MSDPQDAMRYCAGVAGLMIVSITLVWWSGRAISGPYVTTVLRMEGLASGDLDGEIRHTDHRDCIGRLTRAMSVFRQNAVDIAVAGETTQRIVESLDTGLGRLSEGDLVYRIQTPFAEKYEPLRANFNDAMDAVAQALGKVTRATSGINSGAGDIRQASDDLSQRTEQQAASLEETAAAMDEITSTMRRTAEGASRARSVVGETRNEAQHSGEVVRNAVEAMGGIERTSNEISEIISVIDGIAFQTNLLALNAGVEAARAGDAGKGFAVVASEVRALAQRSAEAAKDVKTRINASSEQVEAGVQLVGETGRALERIIGRVAEIDALVTEIASSAEQQASGLQEVNTAVAEMDGVTQQNAAMVEEATAAARSLAAEADALAREVTRFRLADGPPAPPRATPVVHQLQERAAEAGRRMAQPVRAVRGPGGSAAVAAVAAPADDDWSEF